MINGVAITLARETPQRGILAVSDISAPGLVHAINWAPVAGATSVEVTQATVTISPATVDEVFPDVPVVDANPHRDVAVPAGRSVKSIGLDAVPLPDQRLTLSLPSTRGGFEAPLYASKGVGNGPMAPSSPQGASLADGVFALPRSVTAAKLRLSMVTGDKVTEFNPVAFTLSKVNLQTSTTPRNLRVLGPDNATLWQSPELPVGSAPAEVDLKVPLETAFKKSLAAPGATITIAADAPSRALVTFGAVRGALLRMENGILATALDGAPKLLGLKTQLANEVPTSATGDLTIRYQGLRILETVSDVIPAIISFAQGPIVGTEAALRIFPPEALKGISPARIGILGRAPEDCELSLEFVQVVGDSAGPALGPPAVLTLKAAPEIALHWADVPAGLVLPNSVGLRARANRGRFFWAANDQHPITRMAITDPKPGGRPFKIGGTTITSIQESQQHTLKFAFPPSLFSAGKPTLESDLFLTVEISDLTLRYAR